MVERVVQGPRVTESDKRLPTTLAVVAVAALPVLREESAAVVMALPLLNQAANRILVAAVEESTLTGLSMAVRAL
jgi:hypothetical protein